MFQSYSTNRKGKFPFEKSCEDGIPPEIYKHGGSAVAEMLLKLFIQIWEDGGVVQDFKDANIVHIFKNKGDRACCDNHRGVSLLWAKM